MLISMPTDTSTIFGVFQAIVALHSKPDEIRPPHNLTPNKKFASEIFGAGFVTIFLLHRNINSRCFAIRRQNNDRSTSS
jgi:hypothetical protein